MMNFDKFLKELEESKYRDKFISEESFERGLLKVSMFFTDKRFYINQDEVENSEYTAERYDKVVNDWLGSEIDGRWVYGDYLVNFVKHYKIDGLDYDYYFPESYNSVKDECNIEGIEISANIYRDKDYYEKIISLIKDFKKDYELLDYSLDNSLFVSFHENKNDDFDTSVFDDRLYVQLIYN